MRESLRKKGGEVACARCIRFYETIRTKQVVRCISVLIEDAKAFISDSSRLLSITFPERNFRYVVRERICVSALPCAKIRHSRVIKLSPADAGA